MLTRNEKFGQVSAGQISPCQVDAGRINSGMSFACGGTFPGALLDTPDARLNPSQSVALSRHVQVWLLVFLATVDTVGLTAWLSGVVGHAAEARWFQNVLMAAVAAIAFVMQATRFYGVATPGALRQSAIAAASFAAGAVPAATAATLLAVGLSASLVTAATGLALTLVCALVRLACAQVVVRRVGAWQERILLVSTPAMARTILDARRHAARPRIDLVAVGGGEMPGPAVASLLCTADSQLDDLEQLFSITRDFDRIVIASEDTRSDWIIAVLRNIEQSPHEISLVSLSRPLWPGEDDPLARGNCLVLRQPAIVGSRAFFKRAFDIVAAFAALLLLLPLLLLVVVLVRLESPGPVLFRQPRWGRGGRPFQMLKFRTMWDGAPASDGSVQASLYDRRITRVGRLLRKTSIDELPQLINVLNGTMSIVGPRPHPVGLNHKYLMLIDRYPARHRVRPGITGWAQVNGLRGETKTVAAMQKRVDLDLDYIRNQSFGFDLWILLRTFRAVIHMVNAY